MIPLSVFLCCICVLGSVCPCAVASAKGCVGHDGECSGMSRDVRSLSQATTVFPASPFACRHIIYLERFSTKKSYTNTCKIIWQTLYRDHLSEKWIPCDPASIPCCEGIVTICMECCSGRGHHNADRARWWSWLMGSDGPLPLRSKFRTSNPTVASPEPS